MDLHSVGGRDRLEEGVLDWGFNLCVGSWILFFSFCSGLGFLIGSISGFSFRSRFRFFFVFAIYRV